MKESWETVSLWKQFFQLDLSKNENKIVNTS